MWEMVVSPAHVLAALLAVPMGPNALQGGGGPQKIHNGVEVPACGWPSTVALRIKGGGLVCTATLVHPQVVLTAAHCLVADASDFEVAFGEHTTAEQVSRLMTLARDPARPDRG